MKAILILSCLVFLLSGCATVPVDYYMNPNQDGYTQPHWGGICENCNRQFNFSSAQYNGTRVIPNIEPEDLGLKKGMSDIEVMKILGGTWDTEMTDYDGLVYKKKIDRYPNGTTVYYNRKKGFWDNYEVSSWTGPAKVEKDPTSQQTITCPYCGKVQDIKMAANRWTYTAQQAQAKADAQAQANMQGALLGMAIGMQQAQQQRAIASQQAYQQNTNILSQNIGQRRVSFQPLTYQQPVDPLLPKIPSPSFPTTTTGRIIRVAPDEHIYTGDDGTSGRLLQTRDDEYIYQETR